MKPTRETETEHASRVVWQQVSKSTTTETCDLGAKHEVIVWRSKRIWDTGSTNPYNNGYSTDPMPVYMDTQGRLYFARLEIDFYASTTYRQPESSNPFWHGRVTPGYHGRVNKDVLGRVIS